LVEGEFHRGFGKLIHILDLSEPICALSFGVQTSQVYKLSARDQLTAGVAEIVSLRTRVRKQLNKQRNKKLASYNVTLTLTLILYCAVLWIFADRLSRCLFYQPLDR